MSVDVLWDAESTSGTSGVGLAELGGWTKLMEDGGHGGGGHRPKSFQPGFIRRGQPQGWKQPWVFLPCGAPAHPVTTMGRLETGAPPKCVKSRKFLPLSMPQFPCL